MIYLLAVFVLVLSCSVSGDKVDENLKEAMKIGNLVGTLNTMFNKSTDDAQLASAGIFKLKHIIKAQKTPLHATPTPKRDSQYPTMKASEEAKPLEKEKKSSYDEESTQDQGPEAEGRMLDWNTDDDSLVDDNSEVETSEPKSRDASVGPTNAPSEQVSGPTMPPDEEPDKKHDSSIHASPTKASTTMADPTEIAPTKRADKAAESTITSPAVSPTEPPAAPTTVLKKPIQLAEPEQKKPHPTMPREGAAVKPNLLDLVFQLDGCGKMTNDQWRTTMTFVRSIIGALPVYTKGTHVGINAEALHYHILLPFHKYTRRPLLMAITKLMSGPHVQPRNFHNFGKVLNDTKDLIFRAGGRDGVPRVLIAVNDGASKDSIEIPARELKEDGVEIFAVGLGQGFSASQLENLASEPRHVHMMIGDFDDWPEFALNIIKELYRRYFDDRFMHPLIRKILKHGP